MVLGLLSLATTVPLLATSAINLQDNAQKHQQQGGNQDDSSWKTQTFHINVRCTERMNDARKKALNDGTVVLKDGCLFVIGPAARDRAGHPFTGYSLPFPNSDYLGLVSTISKDPPMLNWIFIDRETHEVKYGVRKVAETQLTGPFDYTGGSMSTTVDTKGNVQRHEGHDRRINFRNLEGFVAVEEEEGKWKVYFDVDNDGLQQVKAGASGKRNAEIELVRVCEDEERGEDQQS